TDHRWQLGYAIVGGAQLILAVCFVLTRNWWLGSHGTKSEATIEAERVSSVATLRLPVVWLSLMVFFVCTGIEAAAGTWAVTLLTESRGVSMTTAGVLVSIYWSSLTTGRLISGIVIGFVAAHRLLQFSIAGIAFGSAVIWL